MGKTLRVLNIEDSQADTKLLERHLTVAGYDPIIERVENPDGMSAALAAKVWDVVVCDYTMPHFNALLALDVLQQSGKDLPFIIISGTVGEELAVNAMLTGAHDYIPKDNLTRLIPAIERELPQAENRRAKRQAEDERRVIFEITQGSITTPNLDEFLTLVHRSVGQIVYAENCFVLLHNAETDMFSFEFWVDSRDPRPEPKPRGNGFASYVLRTGTPLLLTSESKKELKDSGEAEQIGSTSLSWLGVPLRTPARTIGVLVLQHYDRENAYSQRDLEFLSAVGDQVALAIERQRAADLLRESEERYRSVVETASDAIITIDETSKILFINKAAEKIFGYTVAEMTGSQLTMLMPESFGDLHHKGIENYLESGNKHISWDQIEFPGLHRDGREILLELSFSEFTQLGNRYFTGLIKDITERKRTEENLRESNERFAAAFEQAPIGVALVSPDGRWLKVNRSLCELVGYSEKELLKLTISDITHPDDLKDSLNNLHRTLSREISNYQAEKRYIHRLGHVISVMLHVALICDKEHKPLYLIGQIQDITESKKAETALRESEERYRDLVENAIDIIYTLDLDGNYTSVNEACEVITGYSRNESLSRSMFNSITPEFRSKGAEMLAAHIAGKTMPAYELELIAKDGRRVAIEVNTKPIMENGVAIGVTGIARDITERKMVEKARLASELKYQNIFTFAPVGIYQSLGDGSLTTVNTALAEMLGYDSVDELLNKSLTDVYFDQNERAEMIQQYEGIGYATDIVIQWKRKDGSPIWVQLTAHAIKGTAGTTEYFEGFVRDITKQKSAEDALRASNERFHQLANNISDVFWVRSADMKEILYVSPAFEQVWGRPLKNLTESSLKWQEFIVPEDRELAASAYAELMADQPTIELAYRIIRLDGVMRWIRVRGFQIKDADGVLIRLAGIVTDITDQKLIEDSLLKSEERYRDLVENALDIIYTQDLQGNYTSINKAGETITGFTVEETLARNLSQAVAPEYQEKARGMIAAKLAGKDKTAYELEIIAKDGNRIAVEVNTRIVYENGVPIGIQGIARDITERKKAEAALEEAEEKYRSIFENAVGGIFQSTPAGKFISVNPAMARILGFESPADLIANRHDIATQHYVDPEYRTELNRMLGEESIVMGFECEVYRKDGSKIWTHENLRSIRDASGEVTHYEGYLEDITERKQLEEQFRQSQKMEAVGVLAGGIAHDFNNLLTAINGYSDLTLKKMPPDDPLRHNIEEVRDAGDRAAALTSQLLAFSRKQVLKPLVHNVNSVITEIERMLRRIIRENVDFRTILDPELGNIKADPGQIEQVIMNLAVNARDAMPNGGTLTIETQSVYLDKDYVSQHIAVEPGPFVKLIVSDTGTGIDEEVQKHIFDPFFTTKEVGKGTGLGLSTVYGIIKQSGGYIMVYSEIGHGTTFKIYLPCVDETVQKPKWMGDLDKRVTATETILLVEDEEIVRNLVREILLSDGYTVLEAASGKAAIAICETYSEPIHLLLTDVVMPKMGGADLKEHIIKLLPEIKIIFMSGYTDDSISQRGIMDANTVFIEKPFTPDGLANKVRVVLDS